MFRLFCVCIKCMCRVTKWSATFRVSPETYVKSTNLQIVLIALKTTSTENRFFLIKWEIFYSWQIFSWSCWKKFGNPACTKTTNIVNRLLQTAQELVKTLKLSEFAISIVGRSIASSQKLYSHVCIILIFNEKFISNTNEYFLYI